MIIEANGIQRGSRLNADVCVIGTGAAGIPLALTLADAGVSVLLLEAGFAHEDAPTQSLYAGEVANERLHSPPDKYRQRRLGGSTLIWGGRCVPFDPIDFETRDFIPFSGWPVSYDDVATFYPQANAWNEAGRYQYDADEIFAEEPLIKGFHSELVLTNSLERFSCPTNFGGRYLKRLGGTTGLTVVTGANCTAIRLQSDKTGVRELEIATLAGNRFFATGKMFVLAVGGLETARLLLASRNVAAAGIGNEHDVVGRYYMCHIAGSVGALSIKGPPGTVRHGYELSPDGIYCRRRFSVKQSEQRRLGLSNMVARLHFSRIADPAHRNGVLSGLYLAKNIISYEYGKRLNDGERATLAIYARHLRNVMLDPIDTTAFLLHWLRKRTLALRRYPSVILRNRTNRFSLDINAEQIPLATSRVSIIDSTDALGVPRLRVDWRYSPDDIESIRRTLEVFRSEFEHSGVASFAFNAEDVEQELIRFGALGGHHIGTARMGTDPRTSVVDSDCRVHSVNNLYVAGSAVFPTSSQANPTLTIVALALRLAEHLVEQLGPAIGHAV